MNKNCFFKGDAAGEGSRSGGYNSLKNDLFHNFDLELLYL